MSNLLTKINETIKSSYDSFKLLLRETKIEVVIGACVGAFVLGIGTYYYESQRGDNLPLAFSERGQMLRDIDYGNFENNISTIGPMADYLTSTNDTVMKIFEAWNRTNKKIIGDQDKEFANELDIVTNMSQKIYHDDLASLLYKLPEKAENALKSIQNWVNASKELIPLIQIFNNSWDENHQDHYRTEVYTEEVCTSNGKNISCHSEIKTRQVYDHTTHTYTYHPSKGEKADLLLEKFLEEFPNLQFKEQFPILSKTNAEGEYAAEESNATEICQKQMNQEQCFKYIARSWEWGSTLKNNLPAIYMNQKQLFPDSKAWKKAKKKAKSISYNTHSRSDSGPKEFEIVQNSLRHQKILKKNIDEILMGINYTKRNALLLKNKNKTFIEIMLNNSEGDGDTLKEEILQITKQMYITNFKYGYDVEKFSWGKIALFVGIGLLSGGLIGSGWNYLGERKRPY